jgi:DNA-binding NarL/FixJ family response regulator
MRAQLPALRILLADDHVVVREAIRILLEHDGFAVVGETDNGRDAVAMARTLKPDVAVLDLIMPRLNGLDAGGEIARSCPGTAVLLLTMHTEEGQIAAALRAGIRGYVLKTQAVQDLVRAIRDVVRGKMFLSPGVSSIVIGGYLAGEKPPADPLAPREREVLQLVAEGQTSKEVATLLGVSVKTAESYRAHLMKKLGIHETAGLVRYAVRHGLVVP